MTKANFVDVVIVGAGLSGIGSARHLQRDCPDRTFTLLESRADLGGTWDLFRYPGIRSDSDMYTLGYTFKPWLERKSLADGPSILRYLRETAAETGIDKHIHYNHNVLSASWSSESSTWTVSVQRSDADDAVEFECNFLMMCGGYYDYDKGHTPNFSGRDSFKGTVIHAQHWPEDLDYKGKKVIVIGSGATAVTLVPELAKQAAQTTMLQRSPTYVASIPEEDSLSGRLNGLLPASWVYRVVRWKRILLQIAIFNLSRKRPKIVKKLLLGQVREALGEDYDIKTHFTPNYDPWDQRLCAVPEGDLFTSIAEKRAEVVTDHVDYFTQSGIHLKSGRDLEADIIVLATGLTMKFIGGTKIVVDGAAVDPATLYVYRGMMLANIPNLVQVFGYTNASWTLKSDLTGQYVCRLLNHMKKTGTTMAVPTVASAGVEEEPMLDFSSGYILRAVDKFPKQGKKLPWRVYQNFILDFINLRLRPIADTVLKFK